MRILISDINDNAPAFLHSVYEINIDEDEDVGYALLTATADDKDEGTQTQVYFMCCPVLTETSLIWKQY